MKLRSFFSVLTAMVGIFLLIAVSGVFWLAAQSPLTLLQGVHATPTAAMLVPRQAPLMVSLLVNPDRVESFRQVITPPGQRRRSRAELNQLKQNLLAKSGLDYQTDIQPWLGQELTLAVTTLDIDRQEQNGLQPGYLLALTTQEAGASRQFLERFWQQQALQGRDLVFEQYQGIKLISAKDPSLANVSAVASQSNSAGTTVATAMVGNQFVLFANHPKVLRNAINNIQATDLELGSAKNYQQAIAHLEQGRIGLAFLNLPALARWNPDSAAKRESKQPDPDKFESLALSLGLDRRGLMAETTLVTAHGSPDQPSVPKLSRPVEALDYIPATTALAASGIDLDQLWTEISAGLSSYDLIAKLVNQPLQDLQTRWGLNFPEDIFAWVTEEYALAMVPPAPAGSNLSLGPNWVFVAQSTEPQRTENAIQQLDQIAQQHGLGVGPLTLAGKPISTWTQLITAAPGSQPDPETKTGTTVLGAKVIGAHAGVDSYQIFASSLAGMEQSLQAPQNSLLASKDFEQAITPLPTPNRGYLYLNWAASRPFLAQRFPLLRVIEVAGEPFFRHLRSLSLTSYGTDSQVQRSQIFIRLT